MTRRAWRSKTDGMNARRPAWACKGCGAVAPSKIEACPSCGSTAWWYLSSQGEVKRFSELYLRQTIGEIERLETQRKFDLVVNGQKVTSYTADAVYRDRTTGKWHVEDVKPEEFQTQESRIKIALFNAIMGPRGFQVEIIKR